MDENARWGVGIFVTIFLATGGAIVAAFRGVSGKISALHVRVDEVKKDYVRRDDLAVHMDSLEKTFSVKTEQLTEEVSELRDDLREHNRAVLAALSNRNA